MASATRLKYGVILAILLGCGLAMLGASQQWFSFELRPGAGHGEPVTIEGTEADQAVMALALAGLALAGALAIAGRIVRVVLGVLGVVVGASLVLSTVLTLADAVGAGAGALTKATGIEGDEALSGLIARTDVGPWPWFAVAGGVLLALAALAALVTGARWPAASHKYGGAKFAPADGADETLSARDRAIDDWDELSRGDDPTR